MTASDDMHDSPVTPAPVGEVLSEEMIDAGAEAYHIAADAAITKAKAKNAAYENAGRLITVPEVAFPKDWLAPVYLAMRQSAPPSDTSGEAVAWRYTGRDKEALAALAGRVLYDTIPFTCDDAKQLLNLLERSERERKGHASALAAAEARGVREGLELAAMSADRMAIEFDNEVHATLGVKRDPVTRHARKRAAETIATTLRSLSPAHKGSEK